MAEVVQRTAQQARLQDEHDFGIQVLMLQKCLCKQAVYMYAKLQAVAELCCCLT